MPSILKTLAPAALGVVAVTAAIIAVRHRVKTSDELLSIRLGGSNGASDNSVLVSSSAAVADPQDSPLAVGAPGSKEQDEPSPSPQVYAPKPDLPVNLDPDQLRRTNPLQSDVLSVAGITADSKAQAWKALRGLGDALSQEEIEALYGLLWKPVEVFGFNSSEVNAFKNDVLDLLIEQEHLPSDLGRQMIDMASNADVDATWRDYVVQHFDRYYDARWSVHSDQEYRDEERAAFESNLWHATTIADHGIAGTALLALERISRHHVEIGRQKVGVRAREVAKNEASSVLARVSALQVVAQSSPEYALPLARTILDGQYSFALWLSAIAILRERGDEIDVARIRSLLNDDVLPKDILPALASAEKRLAESL